VALVKVTTKIDSVLDIKFWIVDAVKKEIFDDKYELHYKNIPNTFSNTETTGRVAVLPQNFSTHLKISKTDAISGATWSFNMFIAALEEALKKYRRKAK
jgi:hypothetical protein